MSSLKIIAERLGISITTVSKALNDYADVSEATKRKVRDAVEQLGYAPNMAARNLARGRSNIIGLVLSDIRETDSNGNIIFRILIGAKNLCSDRDFELLIINSNPKKQEDKSLSQLCRERQIAGVILYGLKPGDPYFEEITASDLPSVVIDIRARGNRLASVTVDNVAAVREVIRFLHDRGHRRIGFINGLPDADVSGYREAGYRAALEELGLPVREEFIVYADYYEDLACDRAGELLSSHPSITALFCASDLMALGALKAIRLLGKRVPEDVAVVGFDGIQLSDYSSPRLTTVVQDFKEMGRVAAEMLIRMVNGEKVPEIEFVPYQFRTRESV